MAYFYLVRLILYVFRNIFCLSEGSQHYCKQTIKNHQEYNVKNKTTHRLPHNALGGNSRFHTSDMILHIHSDASYLSKAKAHSRACGHFFMGWKSDPTKPIKLNGAFFTLWAILRFVVASAAEAELGALFLNCKYATIF